jgi:hypothetical protein
LAAEADAVNSNQSGAVFCAEGIGRESRTMAVKLKQQEPSSPALKVPTLGKWRELIDQQ